uniref:Uncharacterized protein n=1 Tax=Parascaris equorum TaxID=6256 RepID=A0A914SCZ4_PAREQ
MYMYNALVEYRSSSLSGVWFRLFRKSSMFYELYISFQMRLQSGNALLFSGLLDSVLLYF